MKGSSELKFTKEHEWVRVEGESAVVGITDHAQEALGDVVYLELPEIGDTFEKGDVFGVVESVKTTSDLYAPVGGTVEAVHETLVDNCSLVNEDCYGEGWMVRIKMADPGELGSLMDQEAYEKYLAEEAD